MEKQHREREGKYKNYTMQLKERFKTFESESQKHYASVIKKMKHETDELLLLKEDMLFKMKDKAKEAEDELNLIRAQLYKAKKLGVSTVRSNFYKIENRGSGRVQEGRGGRKHL